MWNQRLSSITKNIIEEELEKHRQSNETSENKNINLPNSNEINQNEKQIIQLNLPYGGEKGQNLIRKLKHNIEITCKGKLNVRTTYTPCKLGSKFPIKDRTKLDHQHNVCYHINCANKKCQSHYIGETKRRIAKRMLEHNNKDKKSHVLVHSKQSKHRRVYLGDVKIIGKGYRNHFKRRISESLFIKEQKPNLNIQKDAFKLKLFN